MNTDLTYTPDFRHLFEAGAVLARRRYTAAQRLRITLVLFVSMLGGGLLAAVGGTLLHLYVLPEVPKWVLMIALLVLVFAFYWKVLLPWQYRSSADFVNAASPRGPMRFLADEEGLRWQDADIDFHLRWRGVEAIYATPSSLSFMSGVIGLVLPLSAFPDDTSRQSFLADALNRIPPEAAAKSRADVSLVKLL